MKQDVYYIHYNLDHLSDEEIMEVEQNTNTEMEKITKMWFVENVKWLNDMKNKYWYDMTTWNWYFSEHLIEKADNSMWKKLYENWEKYDFQKWDNYIDVKTLMVSQKMLILTN